MSFSLPVYDAAGLAKRVVSTYKDRSITINFRLEANDADYLIFAPICQLSIRDQCGIQSIQDQVIKQSVEKDRGFQELSWDNTDKGKEALKQVKALTSELATSAERLVRDCLLASGLLEPRYSISGYQVTQPVGEESLADHLLSLHDYLLVFDTNIFIKNLFTNYLRMRCSDLHKMSTATIPAVIWELERQANSERPRESRLGKNAFRDVEFMQRATEHLSCMVEDTEANPTDRLIRRQIRNLLNSKGERIANLPIFVTFDRINALAAHAEGTRCCSLDLPELPLKSSSVKQQPLEVAVGCLLTELAMLGGNTKITCEGMDDSYLSGDWAGKTSNEWIDCLVRMDNLPIS